MSGRAVRYWPAAKATWTERTIKRPLVSAPAAWYRTVKGQAASLASGARIFLTLLLAVILLASAAFYTPATHQLIESDAPAAGTPVKEAAKASREPVAPAKGLMPGICTGHCAAHFLTLPALSHQPVVPIMIRSAWLVVDDLASQASRPALPERPPRV